MNTDDRQCAYMAAAYPDLDAADTCDTHRHEPRVFALAEALARSIHEEQTGDEQVAWFLDDADSVVDDFDPAPEAWEVSAPTIARESGLASTLTINGRPYVVQESEWEPAHPVARATWESWHAEEDRLPIHRTEAGWPHCSTCDGGGCPDCTDPA